jgi:ABC-type glucose/galactose transport system permease subunit
VISRPLIIILALGAAGYRVTTGAYLEAGGLVSMALGLTFLQMAQKKPAFKSAAIACFTITACVIGYVLYRNSQ